MSDAAMRYDEGTVELGPSVILRWDTGRVQQLSAQFLRAQCRCEICKLAPIKLEPGMFPGIEVTAFDMVGRYALQFYFTDGHQQGAYSYDLLLTFPDEA